MVNFDKDEDRFPSPLGPPHVWSTESHTPPWSLLDWPRLVSVLLVVVLVLHPAAPQCHLAPHLNSHALAPYLLIWKPIPQHGIYQLCSLDYPGLAGMHMDEHSPKARQNKRCPVVVPLLLCLIDVLQQLSACVEGILLHTYDLYQNPSSVLVHL